MSVYVSGHFEGLVLPQCLEVVAKLHFGRFRVSSDSGSFVDSSRSMMFDVQILPCKGPHGTLKATGLVHIEKISEMARTTCFSSQVPCQCARGVCSF